MPNRIEPGTYSSVVSSPIGIGPDINCWSPPKGLPPSLTQRLVIRPAGPKLKLIDDVLNSAVSNPNSKSSIGYHYNERG